MTRASDHAVGLEAPNAGLTLIEMIVALAIGALVIAFLAQGSALIRSFGRIGATMARGDETLAIRDHLRQVIGAALGSGSGSQRTGFAGIGDTAVFTVPGDRLLETGGPVRITLAALPDGTGVSLVETRAPVGGGREQTRRLVERATRIGFAYYGAASGDTAATWSTEWTDPGTSPRLMRIDLAFGPNDGRHWPPFVVLLPTSRPAAETLSAAADPPAGTRRVPSPP